MQKETKKINILFRAEPRLAEQLKEISLKERYSVSELLRVITRAYVEEKGYQIK
jgi:hypothetical protein